MATHVLGIVTEYLSRLNAALQAKPDAELLRLFADRRDADAFALLVHRHGPMVLGACRRIAGFSAEADDAFQATFLALARSAGKIHECVPGWLYRVAVRASRKAAKRVPLPTRATTSEQDPFADVEWRDVRRVLDEELSQLPAKWRSPLVLCYLEGLSRDEAARRSNCSLRSLHRNLAEGRERLRERLIRRGLAPTLLASAVLSVEGLQATVTSSLIEKTLILIDRTKTIPHAVQTLIAAPSRRGLAMKLTICGLAVAGAAATLLTDQQTVVAYGCPPRRVVPISTEAPVQKEKPADDPLAEKVREAQKKAIEYLKNHQQDKGGGSWNWENDTLQLLQPGGSSCLAMLALIESGVKLDDVIIRRGMPFIRGIKPQHTYVVSLQTQLLCKANQKDDADLIKRNVEWLEKAAVWKDKNLEGWSYQSNSGNRADNSNMRYAIAGLYAAHKAGFKVKKESFWQDVLDYYVRTQTADGGWNYQSVGRTGGTHTMTLSGLVCMTNAKEVVGKEDKATATALKNGKTWIAKEFRIKDPNHTFYNIDLIGAYGRATEEKFIDDKKKRDWYREGAEFLLKEQKPGGEWQFNSAIDSFPVISTSFALRFLASRPD